MALKETIEQAMKAAMKAREKEKLTALRALKSAILLAETAEGAKGELSEADEMKLLTKAVKQRRDSAATYQENGREDLAKNELIEADIIAEFLPEQLSEEDVTAKVKAIIAKVGASSMKDMGKVMGMASKELAGKADNTLISQIVKASLS